MASSHHPNVSDKTSREISIAATIGRTAFLVGLSCVFMVLVRFWAPLSHGVQQVAGSRLWQSLYELLHIETALGREQLILFGIVLACFTTALLIQLLGLYGLRRFQQR